MNCVTGDTIKTYWKFRRYYLRWEKSPKASRIFRLGRAWRSLTVFLTEMNKQIPIVMPQISDTFKNLNKAVKDNAEVSADTFDNLNQAIANFGEASKAFRNFADYVERHPEALLKGKRGN